MNREEDRDQLRAENQRLHEQVQDQDWAKDMKDLLLDMKEAVEQARVRGQPVNFDIKLLIFGQLLC